MKKRNLTYNDLFIPDNAVKLIVSRDQENMAKILMMNHFNFRHPILKVIVDPTLPENTWYFDQETMQSKRTIMPTNFPKTVTEIIQNVLDVNAVKYRPADWRKISIKEHVQHARDHLNDWLYERNLDEPHLQHALTRCAFAAELDLLKE